MVTNKGSTTYYDTIMYILRIVKLFFITSLMLLNVICQSSGLEKCSGDVCIPSDYDRLRLPLTNETNNIEISIHDFKILKINDHDCVIKTSLWFIIRWYEPRIIPPSNMTQRFITLEESFHKNLWLPDILIWNLENVELRHFLNNDMEVIYLPNNILSLQTNMLLEFYCLMTFENYPMDEQECKIYFRSYSHDISELNVTMKTLEAKKEVKLTDYSFEVKSNHRLFLGNHSEAGIDIKLQRNIFKYIVNYYIPSGLLVSVSWVINY